MRAPRSTRICSGPARRRRQLRGRHLVRVRAAPRRSNGHRGARGPSFRRGAGRVAFLSRLHGSPCPTSWWRSGARCTPPTVRARSSRRSSCVTRSTWRRRPGAGSRQTLRIAGDGRDRPDALLGGEHDVRRRLPAGRAQLLEVELPRRAVRRRHRDDDRAVRRVSVSDERDAPGALPRRRHARRPDGDRVPAPDAGLQPARRRRVDGRGDERRRTSRGCATPTPRWPATSRRAATPTT